MNRQVILAAAVAVMVGFFGGLVAARQGGGQGFGLGGAAIERARDAGAPRAGTPVKGGMAFVRLRIDTAERPKACLEFTKPLSKDPAIAYRDFLLLDPDAQVNVVAADKLLCLEGLGYETDRVLTIRQGLPAADGEATREDERVTISFGDRPSFVGFAGAGVVLPRSEADGLGVETVNVTKLKIVVMRISDRILARTYEDTVGQSSAEGSWDFYSVDNAGSELGKKVYEGEIVVYDPDKEPGKRNQTLTTVFPLGAALKRLETGAYVVRAFDATPSAGSRGQNNDSPAAAWRMVTYTDMALQTFEGAGGMDVVVRSLKTARPMGGVSVALVAENNDELGRVRTDGEGRARFPVALLKGEGATAPRAVMAYAERDFAMLDLRRPTLDLTNADVAGRSAAGDVDVYMYTERGIYRPGEVVRVGGLIRDAEGRAITDRLSTLVVTRPNGTEAIRQRLARAADAGAILKNVPIDRSAPRGRWRAALEVDGQDGAAGEVYFSVEDFVPQRLRVSVTAAETPMKAGETRALDVDAQFLYGAPGSGLPIEGEARLEVDPNPFPKLAGYRFGLEEESFEERFTALTASTTDGAGKGQIFYALAETPETSLPLRAQLVATVFEPGGRTVREGFTIPVRLSDRYIGLKPRFEGGRVAEGVNAGLDLIVVDAAGAPASARGLRYTLVEEDWSYDWYLEGGQWRWRRTGRDIPRRADVVDASAGAPAKLDFAGLASGDYRLVVEDAATGAKSSMRFGVGWGGGGEDEAPDQVVVAGPAEPVKPGARVKIDIKPPYAGEAQIVIATDRVLSMRTMKVPAGGASLTLRADDAWGAGAYVLVTLMTPRNPETRPIPRRAIGVAYVPVDMGGRTLKVAVGEGLGVLRPNTNAEIPIAVTGARGGDKVRVTLAAVDEGILQLTKFQSPDPAAYYFGKRALGVAVRDDYGRLLNPNLGAPALARQGGDALGGEGLTTVPTKTVALWSGLVTLDGRGRAQVPLALPDFNGELRLMAVAWTESAVGAGAAPLTVRDPVVAELTLPRFIAPGDEALATLTLDNREGPAGAYAVTVSGSGAARLSAPVQRLTLAKGQRQTVRVPLAAAAAGLGAVSLALEGPGGLKIARRYDIQSRAPFLAVAETEVASQAPGARYTLAPAAFAPFAPGEGRALVSYSALEGVSPAATLDALQRYPYGCTEQLTSVALPLLYANLLASAGNLRTDPKLNPRLQETVNRLLDRQGPDGAFGLWRAGDAAASPWLGAYVTDFLRRAKAKGLVVPDQPLNDAYKALRAVARLDDFASVGYDFEVYRWPGSDDTSERLRSRAAAYALYVLAQARKADLGQVRYFHDARLKAEPSPLARAQIGAALAALGDRARARDAFRMAEQALGWRNDGDYYQTVSRDVAAVLALAAEAGETDLVDRLARRLAREAPAPEDMTTQEQAFTLLAADALLARSGKVNVTLDGKPLVGAAAFSPATLTAAATFANAGQGAVFRTVALSGPPIAPPPPRSDGFRIEKRVFTINGALANLDSVRQGDRVVVVLSGEAEGSRMHPAALIDLLPAGLEIESVLGPADGATSGPYGSNGPFAWIGEITSARIAEARDDRFVAAADLYDRRFLFAYVARAVTPGRFTLPAAQIEDMYRPGVIGRTAVGRVAVAAQGE